MRLLILYKSLLLWGLLLLAGCDNQTHLPTQAEQIIERGVLRVGTLYHPLHYYLEHEQPTGLEYELARQFAESLQLKLEMVPVYNLDALFALLDKGEVDLLAAGLANTPQRRQAYRFGPSYYKVTNTLVYRNGQSQPKDASQLTGTLQVVAGSSQAEQVQALQSQLPELAWEAQRDTDAEELLRLVAQKQADYTLVPDVLLARTQRYYPDVKAAFKFGERQPVAWALNNSDDDSLLAELLDFFAEQHDSDNLARLHEKYFGHIQHFDYVDTHIFLRRIRDILPRYQPVFERYAAELDWRLLAAISYQESHWDPLAESYTGVRGMMMLTEDTAQQVGIKDRLDAEQSIKGGAKYLTSLMSRLPESIPESERVWFALAAYNIGLGHVLDVRRLTKWRQQNPDSWADVKGNLPLLHQPSWYKQTRYGYARGREALQFVNNIRQYYHSLQWQTNSLPEQDWIEAQTRVKPTLSSRTLDQTESAQVE